MTTKRLQNNSERRLYTVGSILLCIAAFLTVFLFYDFCSYAFDQRTSPPDFSSYYYDKGKNGYGGLAMPNCTTYAFGRVYEITNERPNVSEGNANTFFAYNNNNNVYPSSTNANEPCIGAIVCYDGLYGHVQVVESIGNDSGGQYIIVSESNYSSHDNSALKYKDFNVVKIYTNDFAGHISTDGEGKNHHAI